MKQIYIDTLHGKLKTPREHAQAFDAQAAIDRKVNEALSHAKVGEQVRDEEAEGSSATARPASMSGLIVDCE